MVAIIALVCSGLIVGSNPVVADPPVPTISFNAVGDIGQSTRTDAVLDAIGAAGDDFTLALGDLSYGDPGGEQAWCDYVKSHVGQTYPFELIVGNHDQGSDGNINDFAACLPNQLPGVVGTYGRQWYVDYPAENPLVRIVMIAPGMQFTDGTYYDYSAGRPRYQWTSGAIDDARARSIPWVVVGMHFPCLSIGSYGCSAPGGPGLDLVNLLLTKKVDLVLTGHEHLYQRSKQITLGAACPSLVIGSYAPSCVADHDSTLTKGAGTVFATSGLGGIERRSANLADAELGYFAAYRAANTNPGDGYLRISATPTELTGTFVSTAGQYADSFTVGPAAGNLPPSAVVNGSCSNLTCTYSGAGSTDADGTIASYAWDFGDGTTGTGVSATHQYAAAGSYQAVLTVTDDDGATASASMTVTATAPPAGPLAADTFGRTVASGWGPADTGQTWSVSTTSAYSVSAGLGQIVQAKGQTLTAVLPVTGAATVDLQYSMTVSALPLGGSGLYVSTIARRVVGQGDYRVKVRIQANGTVTALLVRTNSGGTETVIAAERQLGISYVPGTTLMTKVRVTGAASATIQAKVWAAPSAEPIGWALTASDTTAGLQSPGTVGLLTYLSSATTNGPLTLAVDDVAVTAP